ncbi:hypothetical protein ACFSGI_16455 [Paenibacillus nicotianae]|uniref:YqzN/YkzM domain-containing protein n=1 Tax=Paenibacillus nicotianae TaxID=1526551 RepID=A0ABW4UYM7_9BACL
MATETTTYRKEQFMQASQFTRLEKDVLAGLLEEDSAYTMEQAKEQLNQFMNEEAK